MTMPIDKMTMAYNDQVSCSWNGTIVFYGFHQSVHRICDWVWGTSPQLLSNGQSIIIMVSGHAEYEYTT